MNRNHGLALLAGAVCVSGFAPFGFFPAPVLALAVLFALMQRAALPRAAAWLCWSFGVGLFSVGTGWIYIALHDYGDMPLLLALPASLLFCAFLGLFPALAGYAQARIPAAGRLRTVLVMPATWVLAEWVRGTIFTGFPWLTMGYAHSGSPLAGYAPLLGVYGVSLAAAVSAGLLAVLWSERWNKQGRIALAALAVALVASALGRLGPNLWASDGEPLKPNVILWYAGAQLGHVFVDDKHYVGKPLTLISTWDGDELSMLRTYHHLLEARALLKEGRGPAFHRMLDETRLPGRRLGAGLWQVLDLGDELKADALRKGAFRRGLRVGKGLPGRVVLAPPICVGDDELRNGLARLEQAVREVL